MLRSEDVSMVRIYVSPDIARHMLEEFGAREIIEFVPSTDKPVRKSETRQEMERVLGRIEFLLQELKKEGIHPHQGTLSMFLSVPVEKLAKDIEKHYYRVVQLTEFLKDTVQSIERLEEDVVVLQELEKIVNEGSAEAEVDVELRAKVGIEYVAGVIKKGQVHTLESFLWKALYGNSYFIPVEMVSPSKAGFICFTCGERAIERVKNICTKIESRIVRYDNKKGEKEESSLLQVSSNLSQITKVRQINTETFHGEMKTIAREILTWKYYIIREIEIEAAKEKLEENQENSYLIGQGFILKRNEEKFGRLIKRVSESYGDVAAEIVPVPEGVQCPTHFDTNRLTEVFQSLTNVYGVPSYKEINPTIFTVTTLPFLFGAMFGDIGHGLIVLAFGMYMIKKEKVLKVPKSLEIVFNGRYLIMMAGLWAIYFGFLYADFMGVSFGDVLSGYAEGEKKGVCYFGIDHIWHGPEVSNGATFINSLKMKTSLVIGFVHLTFGMVLNALNALYKKDMLRLCSIIVPQMLIFFSLIGYLIFLVLLKWVTLKDTWPGIISVIIDMLSFVAVPKEKELFPMQGAVHLLLVGIVAVCTPVLLLYTPVYLTVTKRIPPNVEKMDVWMHTIIEGIEFLMGLISNISSYLRLWAVSLAHSELSAILFYKTIGNTQSGVVYRVATSVIWAAGTFAILICLEGLSAVLHSLRLHWIEFGSKFYSGGGTEFFPFTFRPQILLDPSKQPGEKTV
ncbi:V-type H+-transporting ATPase subunit a [Nematocida sp. AWRm77]|nr:V-type H+-transporting ATPase subunit a [Nematocida sp. AWRm77]